MVSSTSVPLVGTVTWTMRQTKDTSSLVHHELSGVIATCLPSPLSRRESSAPNSRSSSSLSTWRPLVFAFNVEISSVQDQMTTGAEVELMLSYMRAAAQFRLALITYLTPGARYSGWVTRGYDSMVDASTTLNDANKVYLGK